MAVTGSRLCKLGQLVLVLLVVCNTLESSRSGERQRQCERGRCAKCGTLASFIKHGSYIKVTKGEWNVTCHRGYDLRGPSRRRCKNRNGKSILTGRLPKCLANCFNSSPFKNGHMQSDSTCGRRRSCKISFRCNSGYIRHGYPELRCWHGRNWTQTMPRCKREKLKCEGPDRPREGLVSRNRSHAIFGCRKGFLLKGNENITCNSTTGTWSSEVPLCVSKNETCDETPNPFENGHVTKTCSQTASCEYHFHCNDGFVLDGHHHIRCQRGQLWTEVGGLPQCVSINNIENTEALIDSEVMKRRFSDNYTSLTDRQRSMFSSAIGYDLVLLFSTSLSIAPSDLGRLFSFAEALMTRLNAANRTGQHRVSAVSFGNVANLEFSLNETDISENMTAVKNKLREIQPRRGREGTGIAAAFDLIEQVIVEERRRLAIPLIMLFTDGNGFQRSSIPLNISSRGISQFDIYAVSVGSGIHIRQLMELVSQPYGQHLFLFSSFGMLSLLTDAILENSTNYDDCGMPGNNNVQRQTRSGQGRFDETVEHGAWPWLALVKTISPEMGKAEDVLCVGSLICSGWVLTSAMCLERTNENGTIVPLEANSLTVTAGEHNRFIKEGTEQTTMVLEIIRHPSYQYDQTANNLALLRLGPNFITNSYVRPVCVPHNESEVRVREWDQNSDTWFAGWGTIEPESDDLLEGEGAPSASSDIPKQARIPLSGRGSCLLSTFGSVASDSFCAGNVGRLQDVCIGDTGGPFVARAPGGQFMLVGVAQQLEGCSQHEQLGVFTKVVHFTDWIGDVTGECNRS